MEDIGFLKQTMLDWVRARSGQVSIPEEQILADTNLIEHAVLDSVDLLELIQLVENQTKMSIDITQVDVEDLVSIEGLCRHVRKLQSR